MTKSAPAHLLFAAGIQSPVLPRASVSLVCVPVRHSLRPTRSGAWIMEDAGRRCGGIFRTLEAALNFIRTELARAEFGRQVQIVSVPTTHREAA